MMGSCLEKILVSTLFLFSLSVMLIRDQMKILMRLILPVRDRHW